MKDHNNHSRLHSGNSQSEPNLTTAGTGGFPPGTTVDELRHYRRKKPPFYLQSPRDNLALLQGSFQLMKTEYNRRYKNYHSGDILERFKLKREDISPVRAEKPGDTLRVEGEHEFHSEFGDQFVEFPWEKPQRGRPVVGSFEVIDFNGNKEKASFETEFAAKFPSHPVEKRHRYTKKPTTLHLEGDFFSTTEQAEQFVAYLVGQRPTPVRRPTTLRLDTATTMDTRTENRDQFIAHSVRPRPPLCKKFTNLHLEGERDLLPEYRRQFIDFGSPERQKPALPVHNLARDGFLDIVPTAPSPCQQQLHPQIPFLRGGDDFGRSLTSENKFQFVEKSAGVVERRKATGNLHLEGDMDMKPEYRNAYVDFGKERGLSPTKIRSRRVAKEDSLKSEGVMEISPEYKATYVDFPRERPRTKRPECSLSSEGEMDHVTEQNDKFVPFPNVSRTSSLKREPELKLEGHFECQPEYRKAYIDYLIRERIDRKHRPLDNLGQHQKQRIIEQESAEKSSTSLTVPPVHPPPGPSRKSTAKAERKSGRNRSLSQIESTVFGPKLTVPRKSSSSSRSSSPTSLTRRQSQSLPRKSSTETETRESPSRKFGKSIRVENLALRPPPPPLPKLDNMSARNKWMRDSSMESNSAFVVLDREVNNNNDINNRYNDQKTRWKPSWS